MNDAWSPSSKLLTNLGAIAIACCLLTTLVVASIGAPAVGSTSGSPDSPTTATVSPTTNQPDRPDGTTDDPHDAIGVVPSLREGVLRVGETPGPIQSYQGDSEAAETTGTSTELRVHVSRRLFGDANEATVFLWNSDDETVGTKTTGSDGNITWTGLPADTYTYGVHSRLDEHLGGGSVTLDSGEHAVVQFEPTSPYVSNDHFLAPADEDFTHAPLDAAGGPRFHYQPGETVTLRAAVRNNETTGTLFGGFLSSKQWPINVTFEIIASDHDGGVVRVDSVSKETTIGSQTTKVVTAEYTIPRAAEYAVRTDVETNYTNGYVPTDLSGTTRNEFSAWDSLENLRDVNWAYNGSLSRASLSGNGLDAKGLDGTNTTVAVLNYGVDTSNPLINRVDQGEAWQKGRLNVVDAYNPDSSGIEDDPEDGYHGTQVASTVWQFAPNASYVIANVEDTDFIDFEDDIKKSFTYVVDEHDPDVVVMSIGRWGWGSETLADAFSGAVDRNTTVIVSAGNLRDEHPAHYPTSPATGEDVWAISSTNRDREICEGASPGNSTRNPDKPDFAAPGCQITTYGTALSDGISGSSFAAPATAGSYAQVLQFAHRHGMTGRDVREAFPEVAINTTTGNGSVDADNNGNAFDDDLDGEGRVMPVGASHELLADDHVPAANVTVEQVDATGTSVTFNVHLAETRGADVSSGGVHLAAVGGGSFETVDLGGFHSAGNFTRGGTNLMELYASTGNVTSGNVTLAVSDGASTGLEVHGWLFDQHDAVYNPYLGRYDRYVARDPAENRSADGDRYVEGETWDQSTANPPFNRHLGNEPFSITDYSTKPTGLTIATDPTARVNVSNATVVMEQYETPSLVFDASNSTDPQGDIETYEWDTDGDGTFDKVSPQIEVFFTEEGTYTVTLRVTDAEGNSDTTRAEITVVPAVKFVVTDLAANRTEVFLDEPIRITATVTNEGVNGSEYGIGYGIGVDFNGSYTDIDEAEGFLGPGESTRVRFNYTFDTPGTVAVTLDNWKPIESPTIVVRAKARPFVRVDRSVEYVTAGQSVTFSLGDSYDPDGEVLVYRWDLDGDGSIDHTGTEYTREFADPGVFTYRVELEDDEGNTRNVTRRVVVHRPHDWPGLGFGPARSGSNPRTTGPGVDADVKWMVDVTPVGSPAVVGDAVYVGVDLGHDGQVTAYEAGTGAVNWSRTLDHEVTASPAVWGDTILVPVVNTSFPSTDVVVALDRHTGEERWRRGDVSGSPVAFGGTAYFPSGHAIDVVTGEIVWTTDDLWNPDGVSYANGTVYFADNSVVAIEARNGTERWRAEPGLGGVGFAPPAVSNGTVYTGNENLTAFDAATGELRWSTFLGANTSQETSPAVGAGTVYVSTKNTSDAVGGRLYALDASTGSIEWTATFDQWSESSPALVDGIVYVGSNDCEDVCDEYFYPAGKVWAFEADTGVELWNYTTADFVRSDPAVSNGSLYVGSSDGRLHAFESGSSASSAARVTEYEVNSTAVAVGQPIEVTVVLENPTENATNVTVDLLTDGTSEDTRTIEIPGSSIETATFTVTFDTSGDHTIMVDGLDRTTVSVSGGTCVESVVAGDDGTISLTEIQEAIDWWAEGSTVPDTGGEAISLSKIQGLIDVWAEGATVSCR